MNRSLSNHWAIRELFALKESGTAVAIFERNPSRYQIDRCATVRTQRNFLLYSFEDRSIAVVKSYHGVPPSLLLEQGCARLCAGAEHCQPMSCLAMLSNWLVYDVSPSRIFSGFCPMATPRTGGGWDRIEEDNRVINLATFLDSRVSLLINNQ